MAPSAKPILGISMGDPGGIGPEICAKALSLAELYDLCKPLVVGDAAVMADAVRFSKLPLAVHRVHEPENGVYSRGTVDVLDLANLPMEKLRHKQVTPEQGKASFEYVAKVIELALAGRIHGTVTCPINKAALNAGGYHFAGHTEIYAELTKTKDYAMMLAEGNFRVVHVSTHVSLREACDRVVKARVKRVIELTTVALKRLGIRSPRIGVAGLNPHCGEGGLFGYEDEQEILPAVNESRALGMQVEGPIPADTIFSKMKGGMYDAVVVMYHDQGHIPTKLVGFEYDDKTGTWAQLSGVNVTLGLPIIRTSVDHGTAFGKAGEGRANPQSLIEAIRMAAHLASAPAPG
ncbi:MAG: 4-hydroxythreonine-4-phosphate dehydrogenase PdxA [Desulfobacterota bacterium]|nr:4-hydroxythreonine-4-phosphate dehydrogenase PdxA [Thermodesulfobacteriota bacterium]